MSSTASNNSRGFFAGAVAFVAYTSLCRVWFLKYKDSPFPLNRKLSVLSAASEIAGDVGLIAAAASVTLAASSTTNSGKGKTDDNESNFDSTGAALLALCNVLWFLAADFTCAKTNTPSMEINKKNSKTLPLCHKEVLPKMCDIRYGESVNLAVFWSLFVGFWFMVSGSLDIALALLVATDNEPGDWGGWQLLAIVGSVIIGAIFIGLVFMKPFKARNFSKLFFSQIPEIILATVSNWFLAHAIIEGIPTAFQLVLAKTDLTVPTAEEKNTGTGKNEEEPTDS